MPGRLLAPGRVLLSGCHAAAIWGGVEREGKQTASAGFRSKKLPGPYDFCRVLGSRLSPLGVIVRVFPRCHQLFLRSCLNGARDLAALTLAKLTTPLLVAGLSRLSFTGGRMPCSLPVGSSW